MDETKYRLAYEVPDTDTYLRVRQAAGLGAKSRVAAERGLPNSLFCATVYHGDEVVGFCRVFGDDGLFYGLADGVVLPEHQGHGIGLTVLQECVDYFHREAPPGAYLMAHAKEFNYVGKTGLLRTDPDEFGVYAWQPAKWGD